MLRLQACVCDVDEEPSVSARAIGDDAGQLAHKRARVVRLLSPDPVTDAHLSKAFDDLVREIYCVREEREVNNGGEDEKNLLEERREMGGETGKQET